MYLVTGVDMEARSADLVLAKLELAGSNILTQCGFGVLVGIECQIIVRSTREEVAFTCTLSTTLPWKNSRKKERMSIVFTYQSSSPTHTSQAYKYHLQPLPGHWDTGRSHQPSLCHWGTTSYRSYRRRWNPPDSTQSPHPRSRSHHGRCHNNAIPCLWIP